MVAGGDGRRESLSGRLESGAPGLELRAMPAMQVREDPVEHDLRVRPFPKARGADATSVSGQFDAAQGPRT